MFLMGYLPSLRQLVKLKKMLMIPINSVGIV